MSAQTPTTHGMTPRRTLDTRILSAKVSREIPLPWLIGIVATLFMQAALMYYQLNALVDAQAKTTAEIKELRATLSTRISGSGARPQDRRPPAAVRRSPEPHGFGRNPASRAQK